MYSKLTQDNHTDRFIGQQHVWLLNPNKISISQHNCSYFHGVNEIGPVLPMSQIIANTTEDWSVSISGHRPSQCLSCSQLISPHILRLSRSACYQGHTYEEFFHVACVKPCALIANRDTLLRFIKGLYSLSCANQKQVLDCLLTDFMF